MHDPALHAQLRAAAADVEAHRLALRASLDVLAKLLPEGKVFAVTREHAAEGTRGADLVLCALSDTLAEIERPKGPMATVTIGVASRATCTAEILRITPTQIIMRRYDGEPADRFHRSTGASMTRYSSHRIAPDELARIEALEWVGHPKAKRSGSKGDEGQ